MLKNIYCYSVKFGTYLANMIRNNSLQFVTQKPEIVLRKRSFCENVVNFPLQNITVSAQCFQHFNTLWPQKNCFWKLIYHTFDGGKAFYATVNVCREKNKYEIRKKLTRGEFAPKELKSEMLRDSRKIHYLTREFHAKFHLKNRYSSCRFATRAISFFRGKSSVEFPRQAMNLLKEWHSLAVSRKGWDLNQPLGWNISPLSHLSDTFRCSFGPIGDIHHFWDN